MPRDRTIKDRRTLRTEKRVSLFKPGLVHVEIPNGIVNIRVGLTDDQGHDINVVEILPNPTDPKSVVLDGYSSSRLIQIKPGETSLPPRERAPGVKDPDCMSREDLVAFVRRVQHLAFREDHGIANAQWRTNSKGYIGCDFMAEVCALLTTAGLEPKST